MYFDNNPFAAPVTSGGRGQGRSSNNNTNPFASDIGTNPFESDEMMFGRGGMSAEDLLATNPFNDDSMISFNDDISANYDAQRSPSPSKRSAATAGTNLTSSSSSFPSYSANPASAVIKNPNKVQKRRLEDEVEDETPIFQFEQVEFDPGSKIVDMAVCNDIAVMALKNNHIIRINLANPSELEDIDIYKRGETRSSTVRKIFLDPTASHLLICMCNAESYYLHHTSKKTRALPKLRGILLESVAWDLQARLPSASASTSNILVGTNRGDIYKMCIDQSSKDHTWQKLMGLGADQSINGIRVDRIPSASGGDRFFVMVATPSRLYQFAGGPALENAIGDAGKCSFQDIPAPIPNSHGSLGFYGHPDGAAQKFAWITQIGVYFGDLVHGSSNDSSTINCQMNIRKSESMMKDIMMTEFHVILLYDDCIVVANTLSSSDVTTFQLPHKSCGLAYDFLKGSFWAFCEEEVYEIVVYNEDRDVWKTFMEKKEWAAAEKYCKEDPAKLRILNTRRANAMFADGNYSRAAELFARTSEPVEEVALQFITCNRSDALRKYLSEKLSLTPENAHMQVTVLSTWLTETFLHNINALESEINIKNIQKSHLNSQSSAASGGDDDGDNFDFDLKDDVILSVSPSSLSPSPYSQSQSPDPQRAQQQADLEQSLQVLQYNLEELKDEFHKFLAQYYKWLDPKVTYSLFQREGCPEDMLIYADLIKDYERIVAHHMRHGEYGKALAKLKDLSAEYAEIVYRFSPELMRTRPAETVAMWLKLSYLEPRRLFPALMRCEGGSPEMVPQAVLYLKSCCKSGNTDTAVHNYLLSLLAYCIVESPKNSAEASKAREEFNKFIEASPAFYDLQYALRLCIKLNDKRSCVAVYSRMELYDEAIDLALDIDLNLAIKVANMPSLSLSSAATSAYDEDGGDDDATLLMRRLWLKIAKHEVQKSAKDDDGSGGKIRDVMELVKRCGKLIRIEDILPFFSDNAVIGDFEEEICTSLKGYNSDIEVLRSKMAESTEAASKIRKDAAEIRTRREVVAADSVCFHCRHLALTRQFYLFPCSHILHMDCALEIYTSMLGNTERCRRLLDIYSQFRAAARAEQMEQQQQQSQQSLLNKGQQQQQQQSRGGKKHVSSQVLKRQLDMILGFDCPICGSMAIEQITKPFILPNDPEIAQWELSLDN